MADSAILDGQIELLAGGVQVQAGPATGAVIRLGKAYTVGNHEAQVAEVTSALLDGERPAGYRSGNRTISLPIVILGERQACYAARELLVSIIDQDTFDFQYQPENMPATVFRCFRGKISAQTYDVNRELGGVLELTLEMVALPFGESTDERSIVIAASTPVIDTFDTTPTGWKADTNAVEHVEGSQSIYPQSVTGPGLINRTFAAKDLSGAAAIALWGLRYSRPGGRWGVAVALNLSDANGKIYSVGTQGFQFLSGQWHKLVWPLKWPAGFDPKHVTGYGLGTTSGLIIDYLHSLPQGSAVYTGANGGVYDLVGIEGSVRAPVSLQLNTPDNRFFDSAVVHVPPADALEDYLPIIPYAHAADGTQVACAPMNGVTKGLRFRGTYSVWLATQAVANTFSVNIIQLWNDSSGRANGFGADQAGTITASVTASDFRNGLVCIGTVTLPALDTPPESNQTSWLFKVTTPDNQFVNDILLLDVRGSTVICAPNNTVKKMFIDPPTPTQLYGLISGGSDRTRALSILGRCLPTGEPICVHPDTSRMFIYSTDGALSVTATYRPRWYSLDPGAQPVPSDNTDPVTSLVASTV